MTTGVSQTAQYMDRRGSTEGHLVIFDRLTTKSWHKKLFRRSETTGNKNVIVWGC